MSAVTIAVVLAAARVWALLRVQASWRRAIGPSWELIAAALAVVSAGLVLTSGRGALRGDWTVGAVLGNLVFELLLGSVLGLLVALPGWALVGAADQSAHALTPADEHDSSLARVLITASLAAGMSLGLHRVAWVGVLGSFDAFTLGDPSSWSVVMASHVHGAVLIEHGVALICLALALATPLLLTHMLVSLCVAGLSGQALRGVLEPGLRLAAGLLALAAAWSAYPEAFARGLG